MHIIYILLFLTMKLVINQISFSLLSIKSYEEYFSGGNQYTINNIFYGMTNRVYSTRKINRIYIFYTVCIRKRSEKS